jgi:hypothetical protein
MAFSAGVSFHIRLAGILGSGVIQPLRKFLSVSL